MLDKEDDYSNNFTDEVNNVKDYFLSSIKREYKTDIEIENNYSLIFYKKYFQNLKLDHYYAFKEVFSDKDLRIILKNLFVFKDNNLQKIWIYNFYFMPILKLFPKYNKNYLKYYKFKENKNIQNFENNFYLLTNFRFKSLYNSVLNELKKLEIINNISQVINILGNFKLLKFFLYNNIIYKNEISKNFSKEKIEKNITNNLLTILIIIKKKIISILKIENLYKSKFEDFVSENKNINTIDGEDYLEDNKIFFDFNYFDIEFNKKSLPFEIFIKFKKYIIDILLIIYYKFNYYVNKNKKIKNDDYIKTFTFNFISIITQYLLNNTNFDKKTYNKFKILMNLINYKNDNTYVLNKISLKNNDNINLLFNTIKDNNFENFDYKEFFNKFNFTLNNKFDKNKLENLNKVANKEDNNIKNDKEFLSELYLLIKLYDLNKNDEIYKFIINTLKRNKLSIRIFMEILQTKEFIKNILISDFILLVNIIVKNNLSFLNNNEKFIENILLFLINKIKIEKITDINVDAMIKLLFKINNSIAPYFWKIKLLTIRLFLNKDWYTYFFKRCLIDYEDNDNYNDSEVKQSNIIKITELSKIKVTKKKINNKIMNLEPIKFCNIENLFFKLFLNLITFIDLFNLFKIYEDKETIALKADLKEFIENLTEQLFIIDANNNIYKYIFKIFSLWIFDYFDKNKFNFSKNLQPISIINDNLSYEQNLIKIIIDLLEKNDRYLLNYLDANIKDFIYKIIYLIIDFESSINHYKDEVLKLILYIFQLENDKKYNSIINFIVDDLKIMNNEINKKILQAYKSLFMLKYNKDSLNIKVNILSDFNIKNELEDSIFENNVFNNYLFKELNKIISYKDYNNNDSLKYFEIFVWNNSYNDSYEILTFENFKMIYFVNYLLENFPIQNTYFNSLNYRYYFMKKKYFNDLLYLLIFNYRIVYNFKKYRKNKNNNTYSNYIFMHNHILQYIQNHCEQNNQEFKDYFRQIGYVEIFSKQIYYIFKNHKALKLINYDKRIIISYIDCLSEFINGPNTINQEKIPVNLIKIICNFLKCEDNFKIYKNLYNRLLLFIQAIIEGENKVTIEKVNRFLNINEIFQIISKIINFQYNCYENKNHIETDGEFESYIEDNKELNDIFNNKISTYEKQYNSYFDNKEYNNDYLDNKVKNEIDKLNLFDKIDENKEEEPIPIKDYVLHKLYTKDNVFYEKIKNSIILFEIFLILSKFSAMRKKYFLKPLKAIYQELEKINPAIRLNNYKFIEKFKEEFNILKRRKNKTFPNEYIIFNFIINTICSIKVIKNDSIIEIFFPKIPICFNLDYKIKEYFLDNTSYKNLKLKQINLLNYIDIFISEMKLSFNKKLIQKLFLNKKLLYIYSVFLTICSLIINFLLSYYSQLVPNLTKTVSSGAKENDFILTKNKFVFTIIDDVNYAIIAISFILIVNWFKFRFPIEHLIAFKNFIKNESETKARKWNNRIIIFFTSLAFDKTFIIYLIHLLSSLLYLGFTFAFSFNFIALLFHFDFIFIILTSIFKYYDQIIMSFVIIIIFMNTYAFYIYFYHEGRQFIKTYCDSLYHCLTNVINFGLRSDNLLEYSNKNYKLNIRYLFELIYLIAVVYLFFNIITGIIIDAFQKIKEEKRVKYYEQNYKCFICDLEYSFLTKKSMNFYIHCNIYHSIWNYVYFITYINEKDEKEYKGVEYFINNKIINKEVNWLPNPDSFNLEFGKIIEDNGDNNFKNNIKNYLEEKLKEIIDVKEDNVNDWFNKNFSKKLIKESFKKENKKNVEFEIDLNSIN